MVTSSPTKKVKVELRSAIRDGFAERGWRRVRGDSSRFQAPESQIALPLALRVLVMIDSHSYGGATLTANAVIQCDEVIDVLVGFDRASMPEYFSDFPGDEMTRVSLDLGVETAGGLLDPLGNYYRWVVKELAGVPAAAGEFFAMIDGPLADWAAARDTPGKLFDELADHSRETLLRTGSSTVRSVSALALLHGRVELARAAIGGYVPGLGDDEARAALFERELAARFPEYGPLQRGAE